MPNREEVLYTVVTAEQALAWVVETTLKAEVNFTEQNNERRALVDYLSDIEHVIGRIINGDGYDELMPAATTDEPDPWLPETVTCPVCGTKYTEQTKPGTATRDADGNWDRDTLPCPTCSS